MSDGGINTLYPGVDFNGAGVLNVPSRAELQLADPPVSVTISTQFVLGSDGDIDAQLLGPGSVTVTGPFSPPEQHRLERSQRY